MRFRRLPWIILPVFVLACDGSTEPSPVGSVVVSGASGALQNGQAIQLTAATLSGNGAALTGRLVTWESSNTAVATVSATGLVTAGAVRGGAAEPVVITAASEGKSGSVTVNVVPVPIATITPSALQYARFVGQTAQVDVSLRDATGGTLTGRTIVWTTSSPAVTTVSAQGLATAVGPGVATLTVTAESKTATVNIVVALVPVRAVTITPDVRTLNSGQTVQYTATPRDSVGNALTGRTVTWSASGAASTSAAGLVTPSDVLGATALPAVITASIDGVSSSINATVQPVPVAAVVVYAARQLVPKGDTVRFTAEMRGIRNQVLTQREVQWSVQDTSLASITGAGVVSAKRSAGQINVVARSENVIGSGSASAACYQQPVAAFDITFLGRLDSTDCPSSVEGLFFDSYRLAVPSSRFVIFDISSLTGAARLGTAFKADSSLSQWTWDYPSGGSGQSWFLYGTGTSYAALRTQVVGAPLTYQMRVLSSSTYNSGCNNVGTAIGSGLTITRTLNECAQSSYFNHYYRTYLFAGQTMTVSMSSNSVDTYLCVKLSTSTSFTNCNDDLSLTDSNSRLVVTATNSGYYDIVTTSYDTNETGLYQLAITSTAASSMSVLPTISSMGQRAVIETEPPIRPAKMKR